MLMRRRGLFILSGTFHRVNGKQYHEHNTSRGSLFIEVDAFHVN